MPLQHPEWITPKGIEISGDVTTLILRATGKNPQGVLWSELAFLTGPDAGLSMLNLPLYSHKIARAYLRAAFNNGVKP